MVGGCWGTAALVIGFVDELPWRRKFSFECKWKNRFADNHRSTFIWLTKYADVQFRRKSWRLPLKAQRRDLAVLIASAISTRASATNCSFSITNTGAVFDFPGMRMCAREWKTVLVFRWRLPTGAVGNYSSSKVVVFESQSERYSVQKIFSFGYFFFFLYNLNQQLFQGALPTTARVRESLAQLPVKKISLRNLCE